MNRFKFFKYICTDTAKPNKNLFWNDNKMDNLYINRYPIKYIVWDQDYRPKQEGGLGIRKVKDVNTTYLAKKGWKILTVKQFVS